MATSITNDSPPILRLPSHLRVYIFGLAGLGGKLQAEPLWQSLYLEPGRLAATLKDYPFTEERQASVDDIAFRHPLYWVSKQFRFEARVALLRYNVVVLVDGDKNENGDIELAWYPTWGAELCRALRDVAVVALTVPGFKTLAEFIKDNCDLPNLRISIDKSGDYDYMQSMAFARDSWEGYDEYYNEYAEFYPIIKGVKDFWVYYSSYLELEPIHERKVMGPEYDSVARGKYSPDERDPWVPWQRKGPDERPMQRCPGKYYQ